MKQIILLLVATVTAQATACREGFVASDIPGVCVEKKADMATNPAWVSDEKPSKHPEPAYQRGDVKIVDAPNCANEDLKMDLAKKQADAEGRKRAGIK